MQGKRSHSGFELRLGTLAARIRTLKANVSRMEGLRKAEEGRKVDLLERRKSDLEHLLQELDSEDPGVRHEIKYELAKLSYDLSGAFEDFIMSVDSRYGPGSDTR
ncbi:MAG: hypothetical protein WAL20_19225 [Rhodomicrobium sp.]|jgi:hypothetical protein